MPDPLADSPEALLSQGNRVEREEQAEEAQAATPAPVPSAPSALSREAVQLRLDSIDWRPVLQDLNVITAVRSIRSGQASYTADTLHQRFRSDIGRNRILAMALLLLDQRRDLSNYLHQTAVQAALSGDSVAEVHEEMMQLLNFVSEVPQ